LDSNEERANESEVENLNDDCKKRSVYWIDGTFFLFKILKNLILLTFNLKSASLYFLCLANCWKNIFMFSNLILNNLTNPSDRHQLLLCNGVFFSLSQVCFICCRNYIFWPD
jgi:hypothetical protein